MNKVCSMCGIEKPEECFSWKKKNIRRLTYCKECKTIYNKQWYIKNKEKHKAMAKVNTDRRRVEVQQKIKEIKEEFPCMDCGISYPYYVMDFDHLRDKEFNVSKKNDYSWTRILTEIQKCDIVCSNCHRERTYVRRQQLASGLG